MKNICAKISLLFLTLFLSFNTSFSQACDPITLDSISNPGKYTIGSLTESDGLRNGPDYYGATIYYPTNATPPYSGIVIVPGYVSPQSSIQSWGPFLASHGIVTMTIGTNSIWDFPEARRDALLDALITLKGENTRTGSPLLGQLDVNSLAVGGWSMGGGGAQLAATADPSIKAVMALCPWLGQDLTPADINHSVPILIFSAENDDVATPADHADIHYDYTPASTPKMLFEIAGDGHQAANDPTGAGQDVGKIAVSWLKNFLVGDTCYCPLVLDTPTTASKYVLNLTCAGITSVDEVIDTEFIDYQIYPNPNNGTIHIKVKTLEAGTNYQLFSITGAKIDEGVISNQTTTIYIENLVQGSYIFTLKNANKSTQTKLIVL